MALDLPPIRQRTQQVSHQLHLQLNELQAQARAALHLAVFVLQYHVLPVRVRRTQYV